MPERFGKCYLENMVFQMVREVHSENLYQEDEAPWASLVQSLTADCADIKACFTQLANALDIKMGASSRPSMQ